MNDLDTMMHISFKRRPWVVWLHPSDELLAMPTDEKPFNQDDLLALENYLYEEGFFAQHYARRQKEIDRSF